MFALLYLSDPGGQIHQRIGLIMDDPQRIVCPMGGNVKSFHKPIRMQRCLMFPGVDVDLCLGKIAKATGMINVEVGHHDVGDVVV